jgi:hypothetical protein
MTHALKALSVAMAVLALHAPAHAQEQQPVSFSNLTQPASDVVMHTEYAKTIARMAYVWGWPMVNMLNRSQTITKAPQPGLLGGILPVRRLAG